MSTSDAVLEIKDRAETVQGQTWEALVPALLLLPCNFLPRAGSCWGPVMSHITSHRASQAPSTPTSGLAQPPSGNMAPPWLIPAHPSLSQPTGFPEIQGCCRSLHCVGRASAAKASLPQAPGLPTFFFFFRMTFTPSTDTMRLTFFFLIFLALNSYCGRWKKTPELAFPHQESPREGWRSCDGKRREGQGKVSPTPHASLSACPHQPAHPC